MADFTYLLMQWTMPGLADADLKALNIPSMEEAAQIYCNVTGTAVPDLNWYFSYNLFRLAGITQGIAGRVRDGTAANAKAIELAEAHRAAVEGRLGVRAEGRRSLNSASPLPAKNGEKDALFAPHYPAISSPALANTTPPSTAIVLPTT